MSAADVAQPFHSPPAAATLQLQHRVKFYRSDAALARSVAEHVAPLLQAGGSALILATVAHHQPILSEICGLGIGPGTLQERCVIADAAATLSSFMYGERPDPVRFASSITELLDRTRAAKQTPVAAFGEMVSILWSQGKREAAVQLEQLWGELQRERSLSLLCAYPMQAFSRDEDHELFSRICSQHSAVMPAEGAFSCDGETAREIARLQQHAEALACEVEARKTAEEKLRRAHAELETIVEQRTKALRSLSLQVLKLQDLERRRIARELHDSLGQEFVGLRVILNLARRAPRDAQLWDDCDQVLERCITEVRTLSYLLHPPMIEEAGFVAAASWYVEDFSRRSGIKVSFQAGENVKVPDGAQLVLFRVLQESLMNVYRHAHASRVRVEVWEEPDRVNLEVADNGCGIPRERLARFNRDGTGMGVGLTGIRERVRDLGGTSEIISGRRGTTVRVAVPVPKDSIHDVPPEAS